VQQVLVYSDSLSWGIVPTTRRRLPFEARWPGVMEMALIRRGHSVRIIEDCLNGRRTAWHAAQGMATLVNAVRRAPIEPGMPVPTVLVIAPPPILIPRGPIAPKFAGAGDKSNGLAEAYRGIAAELDCPYFDAGSVKHQRLGAALAACVAALPAFALPAEL
jgi:hypothetical protein